MVEVLSPFADSSIEVFLEVAGYLNFAEVQLLAKTSKSFNRYLESFAGESFCHKKILQEIGLMYVGQKLKGDY